jgi:hypothetical protein
MKQKGKSKRERKEWKTRKRKNGKQEKERIETRKKRMEN